jgi:hypothetical protein
MTGCALTWRTWEDHAPATRDRSRGVARSTRTRQRGADHDADIAQSSRGVERRGRHHRRRLGWIDPARKVTGLIMTQILPFADPRALKLYGQFERGVYDALKTA